MPILPESTGSLELPFPEGGSGLLLEVRCLAPGGEETGCLVPMPTLVPISAPTHLGIGPRAAVSACVTSARKTLQFCSMFCLNKDCPIDY